MADILSQEEIDALLEFTEDDSDEKSSLDGNEIFNHKQVTPYDFKRPNRVSKEQLRTLREIHNKMARNLSSQISTIMHSIVEIQLYSINQMTYSEFLMNLSNPTSFNVFSMKPLDGSGILEISPSIAFPIIDKLLGGNGELYKNTYEFSDIELNLLDMMLEYIMQNLKNAWSPIIKISPSVEVKESSPNIIQTIAQNEIVITVVMEITIGQSNGVINICYPVILLESILSRLSNRNVMISETNYKKSRNKELQVLIGGASVNVSAILGSATLYLREILDLKVGDIVQLDRAADDTVIINIDDKNKYIGEIGLQRYRKTIKITNTITTEKDMAKKVLEMLESNRKYKVAHI